MVYSLPAPIQAVIMSSFSLTCGFVGRDLRDHLIPDFCIIAKEAETHGGGRGGGVRKKRRALALLLTPSWSLTADRGDGSSAPCQAPVSIPWKGTENIISLPSPIDIAVPAGKGWRESATLGWVGSPFWPAAWYKTGTWKTVICFYRAG